MSRTILRAATRRNVAPGKPGFTLIELLATMTIIVALAGIAFPRLHGFVEKARVARAIGDIAALERDIESQDSLPTDLAKINRATLLDPWGNPYVYYPFPNSKSKGPPAGARRDKFLVPVNSEYDLYSLGADGQTAVAMTAARSRDDIVRANDGGYVGLASKY